mmetsp:Transcript_34382/g.62883  ORF Transcript_34382/g.62883 Transcript_34382/m.62883 type:complete len:239 (+) Transcript_34382:384-1100(+)
MTVWDRRLHLCKQVLRRATLWVKHLIHVAVWTLHCLISTNFHIHSEGVLCLSVAEVLTSRLAGCHNCSPIKLHSTLKQASAEGIYGKGWWELPRAVLRRWVPICGRRRHHHGHRKDPGKGHRLGPEERHLLLLLLVKALYLCRVGWLLTIISRRNCILHLLWQCRLLRLLIAASLIRGLCFGCFSISLLSISTIRCSIHFLRLHLITFPALLTVEASIAKVEVTWSTRPKLSAFPALC